MTHPLNPPLAGNCIHFLAQLLQSLLKPYKSYWTWKDEFGLRSGNTGVYSGMTAKNIFQFLSTTMELAMLYFNSGDTG